MTCPPITAKIRLLIASSLLRPVERNVYILLIWIIYTGSDAFRYHSQEGLLLTQCLFWNLTVANFGILSNITTAHGTGLASFTWFTVTVMFQHCLAAADCGFGCLDSILNIMLCNNELVAWIPRTQQNQQQQHSSIKISIMDQEVKASNIKNTNLPLTTIFISLYVPYYHISPITPVRMDLLSETFQSRSSRSIFCKIVRIVFFFSLEPSLV